MAINAAPQRDTLLKGRLFQEALSNPELRRTRPATETAPANADQARKVVFELFQDPDEFSPDDFMPLSDVDEVTD